MRGGKRPGAGRPRGSVNKVTAEVRGLAQQYGAEAVALLVTLMRTSGRDEVRVRAAEALLARGYGKPTQAITGDGGGPIQTALQVTFVRPSES